MKIVELVLSHMRELRTHRPTLVHLQLAREELAEDDEFEGNIAHKTEALAAILAEHCSAFYELALCRLSTNRIEPSEANGKALSTPKTLPLDRVGIEYLEKLGPYGKRVAAELRLTSKMNAAHLHDDINCDSDCVRCLSVWHRWFDSGEAVIPVPFAHVLVNVVNRDILQPRLRQMKQPALSLAVAEDTHRALLARSRKLDARGDTWRITNQGRTVAYIYEIDPTPRLEAAVAEGLLRNLDLTRSLTGQRLFRYLVHSGYWQKYVLFSPDPRQILIPGGFSGLTRRLGEYGSKAENEVHRILQVLQQVHIRLPNGELGGFLTWRSTTSARGNPAELRIVLSDALLPAYVTTLPTGGESKRRARMLVPVPSRLPPMFGRPRDYAAQASLQLQVLIELRKRSTELVEDGAVHLCPQDWSHLAQEAGLPRHMLQQVLDRWLEGDEPNPPFLRRVDGDRFTLTEPAYAKELALLIDGGLRGKRGAVAARHRRSWGRRAQRFPH